MEVGSHPYEPFWSLASARPVEMDCANNVTGALVKYAVILLWTIMMQKQYCICALLIHNGGGAREETLISTLLCHTTIWPYTAKIPLVILGYKSFYLVYGPLGSNADLT